MEEQQNTPNGSNSTGKTIGIIVGILLIAGIAYWVMGNNKKTTDNGQSNQVATNQETAKEMQSMKELMESGKPQKCDVSYTEDNVTSSGTIYVSKNKFRGDFDSTVDGKAMKSHMISDSTTIYTWVDGQNTGFKMSAQATEQTKDQQQNFDTDADYDYNCSNWSENSSMFTPPSTVSFTDFGAMMQGQTTPGAPSGGSARNEATLKAQQCGACEQLSEPSKTQCKQALSC